MSDETPTPEHVTPRLPAWRHGRMSAELPLGKPPGYAVLVRWEESGVEESGIWDGKEVLLPAFTTIGKG